MGCLSDEKCIGGAPLNSVLPTGQCTVTISWLGVPSYKIEENTAYDAISLPKGSKMIDFDAVAFGSLVLRGENNR